MEFSQRDEEQEETLVDIENYTEYFEGEQINLGELDEQTEVDQILPEDERPVRDYLESRRRRNDLLSARSEEVSRFGHVSSDLLRKRVVNKGYQTHLALASFVETTQNLQLGLETRRQRAKVSSKDMRRANETHFWRVDHSDSYDCISYMERRKTEMRHLGAQLGCEIKPGAQNCWGSYRDIAREMRHLEPEWQTTNVTSWLRSLKVKEGTQWESVARPYSHLIPYLPEGVMSYMDYGCGSGHGAFQIADYYGKLEIFDLVDRDNNLAVEYVERGYQTFESPVGDYDLVTMVNVLHHIPDATKLLFGVMASVKVGGILLIKEHFVNETNVILATLVHEMYEKTEFGDEIDDLYFRAQLSIVQFFRVHGWVVTLMPVKGSDIGDVVLICRNAVDGGKSQIVQLEEKVDYLLREFRELKLKSEKQYFNSGYDQLDYKKKMKNRQQKAKVIDKHDLAESGGRKEKSNPTGDVGYVEKKPSRRRPCRGEEIVVEKKLKQAPRYVPVGEKVSTLPMHQRVAPKVQTQIVGDYHDSVVVIKPPERIELTAQEKRKMHLRAQNAITIALNSGGNPVHGLDDV